MPDSNLVSRLNEINGFYHYKQKVVQITDLVFEEQMTNIGMRAIAQSLLTSLAYSPTSHIVRMTVNHVNINYIDGSGTPYDPFVPQNDKIIKNVQIQSIEFNDNRFETLMYVQEMLAIFKSRQLRQTLRSFKINENLLKEKGVIMLMDKIKNCTSLEQLYISNCKIQSTGISCALYILDYNKLYVKALSIAGCTLKTQNQVKQLAQYIKNCVTYKQRENFEYLDISQVISSIAHAETFVEELNGVRIQKIVVRKERPDIALVLKRTCDRVEL